MSPQEHTPRLASTDRVILLWSVGASLFWAAFLWGFFDRGVFALGLNATIWFGAMLALFAWAMGREGLRISKQYAWFAPFCLIAFSYFLYDNPFLKAVSILVLVGLFPIFSADAFLAAHGRMRWSSKVVETLIWRSLSVVTHVRRAGELLGRLASQMRSGSSKWRRIAIGIVLFLAIAMIVVIPLLSAADAQFAAYMSFVNEWVKQLFESELFGRALVFFLLSVGSISAVLAWARPLAHPANADESKPTDSIVAGIVLGGTLAIYLLFLWIQLGRLWVGSLPVEFSETERLVKDGFWQLLSLTFVNILLTFATYRRTVESVQRLLVAFGIASLLLLASAGQRMALYVINYGLSYEKFFASYAVLWCAILLVWTVSRLFVRERADIIRFPAMLFLWMYAILAVMPVEQIVMRSNVELAKREGSQIRLFELTMLSPDVLGLVKRYQKEGVLEEKNPYYSREQSPTEGTGAYANPEFNWNPWIEDRSKIVDEKAWYELNLSNLIGR